jgi:hypothetical protein
MIQYCREEDHQQSECGWRNAILYIIFLMMVRTASGHNLRGLSAIASSKVFGPEVSPKETLLP